LPLWVTQMPKVLKLKSLTGAHSIGPTGITRTLFSNVSFLFLMCQHFQSVIQYFLFLPLSLHVHYFGIFAGFNIISRHFLFNNIIVGTPV